MLKQVINECGDFSGNFPGLDGVVPGCTISINPFSLGALPSHDPAENCSSLLSSGTDGRDGRDRDSYEADGSRTVKPIVFEGVMYTPMELPVGAVEDLLIDWDLD
jgi:hypothetical protein